MSEMKFTPGPWAVEKGEGHHWMSTVITARHAGMTAATPLATVSNILGEDDALPDATLIAAAPRLLDALMDLMSDTDVRHATDAGRLKKARSAIALATGTAPGFFG